MSANLTRWPAGAVPQREPSISLPERWRQAIARRAQPAPDTPPQRLQAALPEDFADTQPDCHGR